MIDSAASLVCSLDSYTKHSRSAGSSAPNEIAADRTPAEKKVVDAKANKMLAKGKSKMAAIGAAMRKLAHLCFGVVNSGKPYDPKFAM